MGSYSIIFVRQVIKKDLPRIPAADRLRVLQRVQELGINPRPWNSKKLSSREEYRLRQGDYRILYIIADTIRIVEITRIAHRRSVYYN